MRNLRRYPSNDLEVVVCPGTVVDSIYIVPTVDKRRFTPCQSSGGRLYIQWKQVDYVLEDYMYDDYNIESITVIVGDRTSTKYVGIRKSADPAAIPDSFIKLLIPQNTFGLLVNLDTWGISGSLESKYFDQILSTFRFVNAN